MRIGIVNDVALIAEVLRRLVTSERLHQVAWIAHGGEDAVRLCAQDTPDLVLMDLIMPDIDGVEATRRIMQHSPCAVLLVTASPDDNTGLVFRALGAGALDVVATPIVAGGNTDGALMSKIRMIGKLIAPRAASASTRPAPAQGSSKAQPMAQNLVGIGASTGGPAALARILLDWQPGPTTCAVIIQHIDLEFADRFAAWLADQIGYPVQAVEDGMVPAPGKLLVARTNDHLALEPDLTLRYRSDPTRCPYRPSVDVFFHAMAAHWPHKAAGVLLTGMGRDGARGLLALRKAGKRTLAQDQASSAVYGMPRAAAELGAAETIAPVAVIGDWLKRQF